MRKYFLTAALILVSASAFAASPKAPTFDHGGLNGRAAVVCDVYIDAACAAEAGTSAPDAASIAAEANAPNGSRVFNH